MALELPDDPLLPEPAPGGGALIGYARVTTATSSWTASSPPSPARGCIRIFADKKSGKNADR